MTTDIDKLENTQILDILTSTLAELVAGNDMDVATTDKLMSIIMSGGCPEPLLAAIITAWRIKGESAQEIATAASVMRDFAHAVSLPIQAKNAVDIVGTGGDGANLFNISTAAAFVVAVAGVPVAKHGSTGVSSKSGASDMLTNMGVNLMLTSEQIAQSIDTLGIGFMFAPNHHPAMRHAKAVRGLLKIRTIFNILGPLTNPARPPYTVLGVFRAELCEPLAFAMGQLGSRRVWVVCADDGLDEISLAAPTTVAEYKDGQVKVFKVEPKEVGIIQRSLDGLSVAAAEESYRLIKKALSNQVDSDIITKAQDIIALNAGAALYISGRTDSYKAGVMLAHKIITTGQAIQKISDFISFSQRFS